MPLTAAELAAPLAWAAVKEYLPKWSFEKSQGLIEALTAVAETKWGNDEVYQPIQEATDLFLHAAPSGRELWAKIEFKRWAAFTFLRDEDQDGFPEFYAQVHPAKINPEVLEHLAAVYAVTPLTREDVETWANELASYWYPSYNTDIARDEIKPQWPAPATETEAVAELGGLQIADPLVVIKGKPLGYTLYNVFVIDGMKPAQEEAAAPAPTAATAVAAAGTDPSVPAAIRQALEALKKELDTYGAGSYETWSKPYDGFYKYLNQRLSRLTGDESGLPGNSGFIFFKNSLAYIAAGDLQKQPAGKNPFPVIVDLKQKLAARGIDFLFVPVPVKPEVYPEKFYDQLPKNAGPYVNPSGRKFVRELLEAGVEVVDLLPVFLAEKDKTGELLYQKLDTHWNARGLELAAQTIAGRVKKFGWYAGFPQQTFSVRDSAFTRVGDIVSRLKTAEQTQYPPQNLVGHQVLQPDGTKYKDSKNSPILMLGDSFCGVYQRTDCQGAGVTAHLAKNLGMPVHLIMSYGGGPTVVVQLKKAGVEGLAGKRLVIWMMVARDFYNYFEDWQKVELE
jgi:alginate O-acetyltransferase complex protein AlgJ